MKEQSRNVGTKKKFFVRKQNESEPTGSIFQLNSTMRGLSLGKARQASIQTLFRPGLRTGSAAFHGSAAAVHKDYLKAIETEDFTIHPYSTFRHDWLIMMMVMMFVNFIIIPLGVSFFTEQIYTGGVWISYILLTDGITVADLVLNFYIGYVDEKEEIIIMDRKKIKNHYLKTWFVVDLIGIMPVDYVFLCAKYVGGLDVSQIGYATSRLVRLIKLTRIMSLLRLLRFSSLMRYVRYWKEIHEWDVGMTKVLHLIYWIAVAVLFCHWNACLQFLIVLIQEFPENSWVHIQGLEPAYYSFFFSP
ncbi:potassium/sodium hyperpolarization-activated cyclic nucleotide-gated channel 1-like [Scyliorhinus torazame]|uniref:potassium/sodium hyperpolarization-activated cyclic nucleotide-gated channel 1-like n=1 Tax=Scyliorhinus torazame TaxID=75743 RepID=UPI003B58E0A7